MSQSHEFALPDVGEGLTEAEVVAWHVAVGDVVAVNDTLVEIETAKSVVELPSPFAGVVQRILAEPGETVAVGTPVIVIGEESASETTPASGDGAESPRDVEPDPVRPEPGQSTASRAGEEQTGGQDSGEKDSPQVLVGPGPREAAGRRRRLGSGRGQRSDQQTTPDATGHIEGASGVEGNRARTTPPVRRLARDLGIDLEELAGEHGELIDADDVRRVSAAGTATAPAPNDQARETRIPVRGVRRSTAAAVTRSAFTAPHVTEWLTVDVTASMDLVRQLRSDRGWSRTRVTPLLVVARAFLAAVRAFPDVNATWEEASEEIVVRHFVNLGIAAATPRGLLVPNIKDAHLMDLRELADALENLVETARTGKTQMAEMANGTLTITNIGSLGVDAGTPILNPGESAILAFGSVRKQPWVVENEIRVREVTTLAMSFDHRLVDGELGSQVLARTGQILTDPSAMLIHAR